MLFACGERIKLTSFLMRDYVPDEKYVIRIPVPDIELRSADKKSIYRRRLFVVPAHKHAADRELTDRTHPCLRGVKSNTWQPAFCIAGFPCS